LPRGCSEETRAWKTSLAFLDQQRRSGGLAPEQVVLFLTAAAGAAKAAEKKDGYTRGDQHREQSSKRK